MKRFVKTVTMLFAAMALFSCNNDNIPANDYLDVTPNNIAGVWRMESYDNGTEFGENVYRYIEFKRKDRTFVTYDNTESMGVRKLTGRFDIDTNAAAIIWGVYDFAGDWEHRYYVRDLTKERMVWVAVDDESLVQVYVRAELPKEFVEE